MRKTIIAAAVIAGTLAATAGTANAITAPPTRATWAVYVKANISGKTLKVDWPLYSLTAAQTDKAREQAIFNKYCTVLPATCATATIRQMTGR